MFPFNYLPRVFQRSGSLDTQISYVPSSLADPSASCIASIRIVALSAAVSTIGSELPVVNSVCTWAALNLELDVSAMLPSTDTLTGKRTNRRIVVSIDLVLCSRVRS